MSWDGAFGHILENLVLKVLGGGLEGEGEVVVVDFLEHGLDALVVDHHDVLEDEHEAANLFDEVGVFGLEALHDGLFGGAVGEVEHLGDGVDAARFFEGLARSWRRGDARGRVRLP